MTPAWTSGAAALRASIDVPSARRCRSTVHVVVDDLTRDPFQVGYLLTVGGEVRATAVTVHGAVDGRGRPARMPSFLAGLVGPGR